MRSKMHACLREDGRGGGKLCDMAMGVASSSDNHLTIIYRFAERIETETDIILFHGAEGARALNCS